MNDYNRYSERFAELADQIRSAFKQDFGKIFAVDNMPLPELLRIGREMQTRFEEKK